MLSATRALDLLMWKVMVAVFVLLSLTAHAFAERSYLSFPSSLRDSQQTTPLLESLTSRPEHFIKPPQEPFGLEIVSGWDPNLVTDYTVYEHHLARGKWMKCLLEETDEAAGRALQANRAPQSARGQWIGSFMGVHLGRSSTYPWGFIEELRYFANMGLERGSR